MSRPKHPQPLFVKGKLSLQVGEGSVARVDFGAINREIGPRSAMRMAKWLIRYAKWSSVK